MDSRRQDILRINLLTDQEHYSMQNLLKVSSLTEQSLLPGQPSFYAIQFTL
jgi:hypothetical protein